MAGVGGRRPGAGRPLGGQNETHRKFSELCRDFLEGKTDDGPRVIRAARQLLRPIIESKKNAKNEDIPGTEYLVNAASMLGTLEFLAGYAYGKPRNMVDISSDGAPIGFLIEPTRPQTREEWLAAHADSQNSLAQLDQGVTDRAPN